MTDLVGVVFCLSKEKVSVSGRMKNVRFVAFKCDIYLLPGSYS